MNFPTQQHGLILADPPWNFDTYSEKGLEKSPQKHYDCMSLDDLKDMRDDILFATAPDAVCFMWTTWWALPQAMDLMAAWGFEYKTGGTWNKITKNGKQTIGTGYCFRNSSELYLIGKLGKPKIKSKAIRDSQFSGDVPQNLNDLDSIVINAMRREHSRKPEEAYDLIEALFEGSYLELFARNTRDGWASWGNQVGKFDEVA